MPDQMICEGDDKTIIGLLEEAEDQINKVVLRLQERGSRCAPVPAKKSVIVVGQPERINPRDVAELERLSTVEDRSATLEPVPEEEPFGTGWIGFDGERVRGRPSTAAAPSWYEDKNGGQWSSNYVAFLPDEAKPVQPDSLRAAVERLRQYYADRGDSDEAVPADEVASDLRKVLEGRPFILNTTKGMRP